MKFDVKIVSDEEYADRTYPSQDEAVEHCILLNTSKKELLEKLANAKGKRKKQILKAMKHKEDGGIIQILRPESEQKRIDDMMVHHESDIKEIPYELIDGEIVKI